jgi:surface polysaccharide O-acyltransferase-like enzyme
MISGALLLPTRMDMTAFYTRRLKKILIPLVVWSLLTPVFYYLYLSSGIQSASPGLPADGFTASGTINKLYTWIFNFNYATTPLWYLYMLVGLYLFMPIIGAWLEQARKKEIQIFLGLWVASMCLPYVQMLLPVLGYQGNYGNMGILGVCDWNPYGTFYYFAGFLGYLVLAYYLIRFPLDWNWGRTLGVAIPMFLLGYAATLVGFLIVQSHYADDYSKLEIPWYFSGINVFLMTCAIFLVFMRIKAAPSPVVSKIASLTFGVFLCHFFFVQVAYDLVHPYVPLPPYLMIPLMACLAFAVSLLLSWLLSLTPLTRRTIM